MRVAIGTLAVAAAMLCSPGLAQSVSTDSRITCTQRVSAATGARDISCENARATAFVSDVVKSDRSRRVRVDEAIAAPPIGSVSVTDLATTRAAAAASRLRRAGPR